MHSFHFFALPFAHYADVLHLLVQMLHKMLGGSHYALCEV